LQVSLINLLGVSAIAFLVPFTLGFFPKLRIPSIVLELIAGIIVGPAVLNLIHVDGTVLIMSTLGVAFLLFLAGMELDLNRVGGAPLRLGSIGYVLSLVLALVVTSVLGGAGLVISPLLVAIAIASTSVGIVIPVLRDSGLLSSDVGRFTVAGGTAAEFGSIALLGVFFAGPQTSAWVEALLLAVVAVLAVLLLWGLSKAWRWEPGRSVTNRLDDSSSQVRVRFAVMVLLGAAVIASKFGFEAILGTFLAGAILAIVIRGDKHEESYRTKLDAVGFGFFVPVFFVTSGLRFDLSGFGARDEMIRVAILFALLLLSRGVPALLYRKHLTTRETLAAALLQSTNLSFIVVAVTVGLELGQMRQVTGSALILVGLISAVVFPAAAQALLGWGKPEPALAQSELAAEERSQERM
jgi:Kef-type K+ transport system membrane component KefB